ncbi:hypothetical protein LAZ67_21000350, partial [Cordylochernes scorpioides]
MATNLARAESPSKAEDKPVRLGSKAQPSAEITAKDVLQNKNPIVLTKNQNYVNPSAGSQDANSAAPVDLAAIPTSDAAAQVRRNWADITEEVNPGAEEGFTLVQGRKRRRGSANSPTAAAPSSNPGGSRTIRRPQPSAGSVPRAQEIRVTRAHIAEARARQASSSEEHCVYIEHSPELEPFHYLRALDRMLGGTAGVIQITKVNGHQLLGLTNRGLAERLISEGLEVEGTLLRAFPFRKRAERITVGNLPFFVADSTVITALSPYGRVTSIAPKQMKAGPYVYVDGRRDVFITLHEGITIERLPTRLDINIKGQAWPAYLSSGIRCSRCHGQGHRRAICPLLAGLANNTRTAPPTTPAGVPPPTTPAPPQRSAAQPPAPTPSNPAMEVCSAPPVARAALHSSAPRPSPPAAPAFPMEETPPAPPPVTPAPSLQTPGSREPAAPTPDVEMSIVEETFASSTSSAKNATRVDLDAFIEGLPSVSFAKTDALGLGREEVLDLLSSRTKAQRKGPLLSPPQCDALVGLIGQILDLKPGHTSNLYKVLGQVKAELRTTPAEPPTPPLPAPRPSGPTPPTSHSEELMPAVMTPPPPAMEDDPNVTQWQITRPWWAVTACTVSTPHVYICSTRPWWVVTTCTVSTPHVYICSTRPWWVVTACTVSTPHVYTRPCGHASGELPSFSPLASGITSRMATNLARAESPSKAEDKPVRLGSKAQPSAEITAKDVLQNKNPIVLTKNQNYVNPSAGSQDANSAAPVDLAAIPTSDAAAQVRRNWADITEEVNPGAEEGFTLVQGRKRRRGSANSPKAAAPSSNPGGSRTTRRPQPSAGSVPRAQEIRVTRAHIAEARARQASSSEEHCVYIEHSPELEPFHYLRALDRMLGGTAGVIQITKVNGHQLLGLTNRGLAERLISEGLEVEGTLLRAFPFRKRAERITVGNLPFFVADSAVITALSPYGRVTSIAPKQMKAGPYIYVDGRRDVFITLHKGITIERLPTRLEINIKGQAWPAYLSSGIRCSRCHGQGHRRAICPLLAGLANNTRTAPPTTPAGVPPPTTPAPPQRSAAQPPAPTPSNPAMEVCSAPPVARAALHSSAPRPSPPAAPAFPMEETPPAPPPVTPAPSLQTPGSREPAAPTPDVEMSIVEETFASSTSSAKNATRVDLDAFIEGLPSVSFAKTDALGLGREEVLDLLSSRTKAQRKGPLLSPPQCDALVGLIGQILDLKPGHTSNLYKVLGQVKAELRTTPAVPPTPPLPAPRPSGPTPPTSHSEELMPAVMTPPPPALEDDPDLTQWQITRPWWAVTACTVSTPHVYICSTRPWWVVTTCTNEIPIVLRKNQNYVNPPAGGQDANSAAPVDLSLAAIPTSNAAAQVRRNWADITEQVNPGAEEGFTLVQGRKRRRGSGNSPTTAAPSSNAGASRTIRRPQSSAGSVPRAQEIRATRAHIADARARQASSSEEHCVYIEHSPELEPFHYLRALDRKLGGTAGVIQITKVNGHQLLGLTNRGLAERLISEGLEVEGTLLRAFPFRKRAERITVGNLPFFVADSDVITALSPFGRVTSIAPKQMKAGPYVYVDGRRDVFITLHEGITIERLPTRLDINIKGQAWPAYLSSGIRCSRCHGQGHRRAICPLLAGLANNTRMAPPTTPAGVPPPTTSAPPQRSAAQPPAPAPSNLAMEVCSAPPMARAVLHPSAPRSSPPAAPALPMEETPSAPPPVIPAPSLQVPKNPVDPRSATPRHPEPTPPARPDLAAPRGPPPIQETLGPAAPTQDLEMSIVEETTASSASSTRNATRVDLDAFIEVHPSVSFAETDALGLGREEVLDLLSSRTKAQRKGPLLSPPQCDALVGLIGQILDLKPGHTSNLYKVLGQVKAELRTTPAVPPTPLLPAPRPSGPTPPTSHSEELMPAVMTPPPPALEDDPDLTQWQITRPWWAVTACTVSTPHVYICSTRPWWVVTTCTGRKRRRGSGNSPTTAAPSSNAGASRTIRRPQSSAGSVPRAQEIRATRAHIADARARQASSSEEHCVYIEHSPELEPFHYLRALDRKLGGTAGVIQITKVNGHQLLGLTNRGLAERLISEGLEVEGTLLRAFPFRKRAERITVGNLPFFVADSDVITALSPFGRVTSIAPKQMKAGPYVYVDGRRDVFITLHEGITIERLPTRLDINIKGQAWPAYLSSGIRCSRCHGQGHRRAICPLLAGLANNTRMAPPTTPAGVPPPTTSAPPQRSAAQPPAPAPSNLAMEVCSAPPMARAVLHPSAPRSSPPAAPALPMEETPSAPPPVIPAPSLQVPKNPVDPRSATPRHPEPTPPARPDLAAPRGPPPIQETLGPAAPTQDVEMSIVEETTASSASSTRNATRVDLDAFIEVHPSVSFAETDALGLGREEVLDLLSSRTKAQRKGPLLSPPQCDALAGLIGQILDLKPGHTSNLYKVLGQVRAELTKTPAAAPTPPLPAPRPAEKAPPAPQGEESAPAEVAYPPPLPVKMTDEARERWLLDLFKELNYRTFLMPLLSWTRPEQIIRAALHAGEERNDILGAHPNQRSILANFLGSVIERARGDDQSALDQLSDF